MEHISTDESGSSKGRKESVCAQMGVSKMAGTDGWTIDPPAAREYAVDPEGLRTVKCRTVRTKEKELLKMRSRNETTLIVHIHILIQSVMWVLDFIMLQTRHLPVGVATMIPSPCTVVRYCWSHSKSMIAKKGEGPRSITISFKMWNDPNWEVGKEKDEVTIITVALID